MFGSEKELIALRTEVKTLKAELVKTRTENNNLRRSLTQVGIEIAQDVLRKIDALQANNQTGDYTPETVKEA